MRRLALAALAPVVLALLAASGPAAPSTDHFDDLLSEMIGREGDLPPTGRNAEQQRQYASIEAAFRVVGVDSGDLSGDLTMARRMSGILEKGFPGDAVFGDLLVGLNDDLAGDVDSVRTETVVLISIAQAGPVRTRAEKKLAAADAMFLLADAADTQARRARGREKGHRAILLASKLAVKAGPGGTTDASTMTAVVAGSPWAANTKFGTGVSGIADVSEATSTLRRVVVSGRRILPLSTNDRLPGESSRIQITLLSATSDIVPGIYVTGNSNGVNATASWMTEDENENVSQAVTTSGTVEITSLVVHEASVEITGTFSLTMYDGLADVSFTIASGAFEAVGLPRNTVP